MTVLDRDFYSRSPVAVARELVGKTLVRTLAGGERLKGIIVETEAYGGAKDPASHAYRGISNRNAVMFGIAGHAYVYFTYGFHHCLNFVTGKEGEASAVLLRAIEPTSGFETMSDLRKKTLLKDLTSGPGKLCQALAIDRRLNGIDITSPESEIHVLAEGATFQIATSSRIGIRNAKERKWRFFAEDNVFVSKR
ncbi:MAG: DNA-3-methyladenine glycosylase [Nitrososphaerota archaeon]|nr:DNA-3-methyladenine glycosylase [Nitrososphaerota archaeon]